jgi:hypothetical protein
LHRLRTEQNDRLETWDWANDQHTLVRISIGRAMKILVQKGGDAYAPLSPDTALNGPSAAAQNATTPVAPAGPGDRSPERKQ